MTIEQRLDQLEKRNKRFTVALTMMAVAMTAVETMAATGEKNPFVEGFDVIKANVIQMMNNDVGRGTCTAL